MARPSTFFPRRCGQAILLLAALLGCGEEPAPAHRPPAESTRRMADRLQQVARNTVPEENIFQNEQRVEHYRAKLAQAQKLTDRVPLMLEVATEYLLAGHPEQALEQFDQVSEELAAQGSKLSPEVQRRIREMKALCYVRLGEQENCIALKNPQSCLVPIEGDGRHRRRRGSEEARELLRITLQQDPRDLSARWLFNLATMSLGEYPQKVPRAWLIPPAAFASEYPLPRFSDVAEEAGLACLGLAGGICVEDFDRDGLLDVICSSWGLNDPLLYLHNEGDGLFADQTDAAGLTGLVGGLNTLHADYDNDGFADVLVLRGAWLTRGGGHPNSLLRNLGDGTFEDVTEQAGLLTLHPTQTAAFADFDGDGWLDLLIGNETSNVEVHPVELFHNEGDGTFLDVAADVGLAHQGFVKAVVFGDYDNDGREDVFLSCLSQPNRLYHNDGPRQGSAGFGWSFTEVAAKAGIQQPMHSFPTWFFDYDNDGFQDLFVSGYRWFRSSRYVTADYLGLPNEGAMPRLFHNQGDGTFADVTRQANLERVLMSMGCNYGDLDSDGFLDFYVGTGEPDLTAIYPNRMFRNDRGLRFQDVTTAGGFGHVQKGHGVAFADIDNDGDQDVLQVLGGAFSGDVFHNVLFENPGTGQHWISLELVGVISNRSAIGARIRVVIEEESGEREIHRRVGTGGSFGSTTLRQNIGLGQARTLRLVEIYWPTSAQRQRFDDLELDRFYRIREDAEQPELLQPPRFSFEGDRED